MSSAWAGVELLPDTCLLDWTWLHSGEQIRDRTVVPPFHEAEDYLGVGGDGWSSRRPRMLRKATYYNCSAKSLSGSLLL